MNGQITSIYCIVDDILKALEHKENAQREMNDAEVITTALVAMTYYHGTFETAREYLQEHGYIPNMLSKSRFNRRLHMLRDLIQDIFGALGEAWKSLDEHSIYIIDSFPISVCDNARIKRAKIY